MKHTIIALAMLLGTAANAQNFRFDFGSNEAAEGFIPVTSSTLYTDEAGYGFEPGAALTDVSNKKGNALTKDFVTSQEAFKFSVKLPEGNWHVKLTLGDVNGSSKTTVKTEIRRLMVESFVTQEGKTGTVDFIANTRTPKLSENNSIKLNSTEYDAKSGRFKKNTWDDKLTIQFNDERPCICALEIEPADESTITVFLVGDSTVTDQLDWGGAWGQYLPRWFDNGIAVANHAESGMTLKSFRFSRRWDKIMETAKPGDYLFIQLGTNDEKSEGHDGLWPEEDLAGDWDRTHSAADQDYIWELASMAVQAQRKGMIPVIISPMTKIDMTSGIATEDMTPYGLNAPKGAELAGCAFIDLWSASRKMVAALGEDALPMYKDGTHTENYGAYLFSLFIANSIKELGLGIADHLVPELKPIDPAHPSPSLKEFTVPLETMMRFPRRAAADKGSAANGR